MKQQEYIGRYLQPIILQCQGGVFPKEIVEAVFKDADLGSVNIAINLVREARRGGDGDESFFLMDSMPAKKIALSGAESKLLSLYAYLKTKANHLEFGKPSQAVRAVVVNELIAPHYEDAFKRLADRDKLIGLLAGLHPRDVRKAINGAAQDAQTYEDAQTILNQYLPGDFIKP